MFLHLYTKWYTFNSELLSNNSQKERIVNFEIFLRSAIFKLSSLALNYKKQWTTHILSKCHQTHSIIMWGSRSLQILCDLADPVVTIFFVLLKIFFIDILESL